MQIYRTNICISMPNHTKINPLFADFPYRYLHFNAWSHQNEPTINRYLIQIFAFSYLIIPNITNFAQIYHTNICIPMPNHTKINPLVLVFSYKYLHFDARSYQNFNQKVTHFSYKYLHLHPRSYQIKQLFVDISFRYLP